jgi:hypothetical protein
MDIKWNQNGNWLLTAARDHLMKLFDIRNLKEELQVFKGHKKEATGILTWCICYEQGFPKLTAYSGLPRIASNHLSLTDVGVNLIRDFGYLHVRKLSYRILVILLRAMLALFDFYCVDEM